MGEAAVVEAVEVSAGGLLDVDAGFQPDFPAAIHASGTVASVVDTLGQADSQVRAGVHHPTEHEGSEGYGPVGEGADGIGEAAAVEGGVTVAGRA